MTTISHTEAHMSDGDQKNAPDVKISDTKFNEGKPNAHDNQDSKDSRSLNNRAAATIVAERKEEQTLEHEHSKPPTAAAKEHGNKPSRGAVVDEQIQKEETELLENRGRI